jgi:hypothetical protein
MKFTGSSFSSTLSEINLAPQSAGRARGSYGLKMSTATNVAGLVPLFSTR